MIWEGVYRGDLFALPEEIGEQVLTMLTGRASYRNTALTDIRMRI